MHLHEYVVSGSPWVGFSLAVILEDGAAKAL
jgi:hypothetical protein